MPMPPFVRNQQKDYLSFPQKPTHFVSKDHPKNHSFDEAIQCYQSKIS